MNNINVFHSRAMGVMRSFVTLVVLLWFGVLVSLADTHYVAQGGQTPAPDYTDWTTAASNIQDAIDISATVAGDTVLVSNGVYETGGIKVSGVALTNRVWITKAITVRSADNNPTNTIIKGSWASDGSTNGVDAIRCVYMVTNSSLIGFTLTNGATLASGDGADLRGGGVSSSSGSTNVTISNCVIIGNRSLDYGGGVYANYGITLYNCTITSNSASGGTGHGGGVYAGILYNCTLSYNAARYGGGGVRASTLYGCSLVGNSSLGNGQGGGARDSIMYNCILISNVAVRGGGSEGGNSRLYNCTITHNRADDYGGGTRDCASYNCIVYFNTAANASYSNWSSGNGFTNSCTAPAATGIGNITANPMFVDTNVANYRLSSVSPCINAGTNGNWTTSYPYDLDGRTRVRYGTVDMGAYEHIHKGTIYRFY